MNGKNEDKVICSNCGIEINGEGFTSDFFRGRICEECNKIIERGWRILGYTTLFFLSVWFIFESLKIKKTIHIPLTHSSLLLIPLLFGSIYFWLTYRKLVRRKLRK